MSNIKPLTKLPERLIYSGKQRAHTVHRIFDTKNGEILGMMCTHPGKEYLIIDCLKSYKKGQGVGTDLLKHAGNVSRHQGCKGNLAVLSSDCFDNLNPPHTFYRKFGFTASSADKLEEIDNHIKTGEKGYYSFNSVAMYYPKAVSFEEDRVLYKSRFKNFIKRIFGF